MAKIVVLSVVAIITVVAVSIVYGHLSWRKGTRDAHALLDEARRLTAPLAIDTELGSLPEPVRRYFRAVLAPNAQRVVTATVRHTGTFNMGEVAPNWRPFGSEQYVVAQRPGFIWDARIRMAPGITVHVHDGYINGEGLLRAKILGLVPVMQQPPTPELAAGELMRFLAEAAWYPTALLPSHGVRWEAVSDSQAVAVFTDGTAEVRLLVTFDEHDLISTVRSDARFRNVGGRHAATPWQGRFWNYQRRSGMLVPLEGEVAWLLPDGPYPYWRGTIQTVEYGYTD